MRKKPNNVEKGYVMATNKQIIVDSFNNSNDKREKLNDDMSSSLRI